MIARTQVSVDPALDAAFPGARCARVVVLLRDGTRHAHMQRHRTGDPELPLSDEQLNAKFHELVDPVLGAERSRTLLEQLWELDRRPDVRGLGSQR